MGDILFQPQLTFDSVRAARFQRTTPAIPGVREQQALRVARSRRLDRLGAAGMFPCGSVITSVGPLGAFLTATVAVVTSTEFVIMPAEPGEDVDVEYGRVERAAVTGAVVLDGDRVPVTEEVLRSEDELRPDVGGSVVLAVEMGSEPPMTLVFRSAIEARRARDRFREWTLPTG
jgi:hypothetical protein